MLAAPEQDPPRVRNLEGAPGAVDVDIVLMEFLRILAALPTKASPFKLLASDRKLSSVA